MAKPRIGILIGTTRPARFGDRPAQWLLDLAQERTDAEFEIVDLRDYPMPLFEAAASPRFVPVSDPVAIRFVEKLASLDGVVFITAEYNHAVAGALKNALDYVYDELARKPAAFLGYGAVGGARAVEHLRLICVELSMAPTKTAVHIAMEPFLGLIRDGKTFADYPYLADGAKAMLDELVWWTLTLRAGRETAAVAAAA